MCNGTRSVKAVLNLPNKPDTGACSVTASGPSTLVKKLWVPFLFHTLQKGQVYSKHISTSGSILLLPSIQRRAWSFLTLCCTPTTFPWSTSSYLADKGDQYSWNTFLTHQSRRWKGLMGYIAASIYGKDNKIPAVPQREGALLCLQLTVSMFPCREVKSNMTLSCLATHGGVLFLIWFKEALNWHIHLKIPGKVSLLTQNG